MTFKIVDGREHFYQWDLNRQIIVDDPAIKEVHFCNRMDNCSLVVEVENGIANVPNILLQNSFDIRVFAYDGHATLFDKVFEVKARTKPSDYAYTETEVKRLEDVEEKLTKEIDERLKEIESGLITDGFATKDYVDEAVSNVSVDLSGYAKESYVDEAIAQVVSEHETDLVEYAKKTDIPDVSKFITSIPSEYITESELNAKGYLTQHQDISGKADVNHTHTGYAKTNHTHDMADVNGLQLAISERATQADIDKAIELHNHNDLYAAKDHNHDDKYSTRGHAHSYNDLSDKPEIPSVEGLATEQYVDEKVGNVKVDLTGYATEEYVNNVITNIEVPSGIEIIELNLEAPSGIIFRDSVCAEVIANPANYLFKVTCASLYLNGIHFTFNRKYLQDNIVNLDYTATTNDSKTGSMYKLALGGSDEVLTGYLNKLSLKSADNYYTKAEVDNAIANIETPEDDCHVYIDESNTFEDIEAAIAADKLPVYKRIENDSIYMLPLALYNGNNEYSFSSMTNLGTGQFADYISCRLENGITTWSEYTATRMQSAIQVNSTTDTTIPKLKNLTINGKTYIVPEGGESADLSNYYTKEETNQAIQTALNAIGVAEGGAY